MHCETTEKRKLAAAKAAQTRRQRRMKLLDLGRLFCQHTGRPFEEFSQLMRTTSHKLTVKQRRILAEYEIWRRWEGPGAPKRVDLGPAITVADILEASNRDAEIDRAVARARRASASGAGAMVIGTAPWAIDWHPILAYQTCDLWARWFCREKGLAFGVWRCALETPADMRSPRQREIAADFERWQPAEASVWKAGLSAPHASA
jgi:hypothetical protein